MDSMDGDLDLAAATAPTVLPTGIAAAVVLALSDEHHWTPARRAFIAREVLALATPVTCRDCQRRVAHRWHHYKGCTCAAAGNYDDHSTHCDLYAHPLVHNDGLLSEEQGTAADDVALADALDRLAAEYDGTPEERIGALGGDVVAAAEALGVASVTERMRRHADALRGRAGGA